MAEAIQVQMVRMMKWQSRASVALAAYLFLLFAPAEMRHILQPDVEIFHPHSPLPMLFDLATGLAFLVVATIVLIEMWYVFQAGRLAFGVWSGLIYASLTWV